MNIEDQIRYLVIKHNLNFRSKKINAVILQYGQKNSSTQEHTLDNKTINFGEQHGLG